MKTKWLFLLSWLLLAAPVMVQAQVNYAISGNTAYVLDLTCACRFKCSCVNEYSALTRQT